MAQVHFYGTGRRKSSVARVYLLPGNGEIKVNGQPLDVYLDRKVLQAQVVRPFKATHTEGRFDVNAKVQGGGSTGQAGALRMGIARALIQADPSLRSVLKSAGFLTRDPRMKERKKYGLKKARKASQYSKR